jgi:hypothetical protein
MFLSISILTHFWFFPQFYYFLFFRKNCSTLKIAKVLPMATPNYYPGEDFDFELQDQASGSMDTSYETFCSPATTRKLPGTQTTLPFFTNSSKNKGKRKGKIIDFVYAKCIYTSNSFFFLH